MKPTRFDIHAKLIFKVGSIVPNIEEIKSCVEAVMEIDKKDDGMFVLHSDYVTLKKQTEWLPIETAPKDGTQVLFYCDEWNGMLVGHYGHLEEYDHETDDWQTQVCWQSGLERYTPSHWIPLPKSPHNEQTHKRK